ncbi:MAG: uroporphyrinogen-III synthase, partial [Steroidobacteraceae bacterium]
RDEPRDGPLSERLRARGLEVLWWPVLRILPPADPAPLDDALARAAEFDCIVFASRHAVEAVASRLPAPPAGVRIAAVGAATAVALRERGWTRPGAPYEPNAAALLVALSPRLMRGARVLFPASSRALPTLREGLGRIGVEVVQVDAYRNEAAPLDVEACHASIESGAVGAVTFTSPSCVDELERALGQEGFTRLLGGSARGGARSGHAASLRAAAIALGPTTAGALTARGIEPTMAQSQTLEGLAATTQHILNGPRRS